MKNEPTPADRSTANELPAPLLMPLQKKHYLIALIIVLILCIALLTVVLAISAKEASPDLPSDPDAAVTPKDDVESELASPSPETNEPTPEAQEPTPPTSDETPNDTTNAITPQPIPTPTTSKTEATEQETAEKESNAELPPIVIEQVLLSGSAGLVYRSYGNGSCMVESIGSCTDACLIIPSRSPDGDTVIAIGQNAFAACTQLLAVQIPATVKSIGKTAFADCDKLLFFTVSADNPAYCDEDGVLYSKDKTSLLCYPCGRPCPEAIIPASVTYISAGAFSPSAGYSTIVFEGTLAAWRTIHIEDNNHALYTLPKRFGE